MGSVVPLDLRHRGLPGAIGALLLEREESVLVDPGPATTLPRLRQALRAMGLEVGDLRALLLTHVHLDHAGAAGHLAREHPGLEVHVHEEGAPHLAAPGKLVASTRRTFGAMHDEFWGETVAVPEDRLRPWRPGDDPPLPGIRAISTPGHIGHHLAWMAEKEGVLLAGDALGIILTPESPTYPATPAPGVDVEAWRGTLDRLARLEVPWFAISHFGVHDDLAGRVEAYRELLDQLEARVRHALEHGQEENDRTRFREQMFRAQIAHLPEERIERYFETFPPENEWDGMRFYLERRARKGAE